MQSAYQLLSSQHVAKGPGKDLTISCVYRQLTIIQLMSEQGFSQTSQIMSLLLYFFFQSLTYIHKLKRIPKSNDDDSDVGFLASVLYLDLQFLQN